MNPIKKLEKSAFRTQRRKFVRYVDAEKIVKELQTRIKELEEELKQYTLPTQTLHSAYTTTLNDEKAIKEEILAKVEKWRKMVDYLDNKEYKETMDAFNRVQGVLGLDD